MRWLWTLHEAVRSSQICFQFSNGFVGHEDSVARCIQDKIETRRNSPPFFKVSGKQAISILSKILTLRTEDDGHARMSRLCTLLWWQVTSWVEDETVCMANMLRIHDHIVQDLL